MHLDHRGRRGDQRNLAEEMSQGHLLIRVEAGDPVILVLNPFSAVLNPCMIWSKLNHLPKLYFETGKSI